MTHRRATFTEANAWVQLSPDNFIRHFPHIREIWQTEDGRVWVETDGTSWADRQDLAWWELAARLTGKASLRCGCRVHVHYVPHAKETICTFSNPAIGFRARLRISRRLMLAPGALSGIKEALCVHPHDEKTVEEWLARSTVMSRGGRRHVA